MMSAQTWTEHPAVKRMPGPGLLNWSSRFSAEQDCNDKSTDASATKEIKVFMSSRTLQRNQHAACKPPPAAQRPNYKRVNFVCRNGDQRRPGTAPNRTP